MLKGTKAEVGEGGHGTEDPMSLTEHWETGGLDLDQILIQFPLKILVTDLGQEEITVWTVVDRSEIGVQVDSGMMTETEGASEETVTGLVSETIAALKMTEEVEACTGIVVAGAIVTIEEDLMTEERREGSLEVETEAHGDEMNPKWIESEIEIWTEASQRLELN